MTREEEIRQAARQYFDDYMDGLKGEVITVQQTFEDAAKWADENPTPCSVRMVGNQSYSKQQLRENGNVLSPNHLAKKAAHYMIDKACEWLENNVNNYIIIDDYLGKVQPKISSNMFDSFRKAMEE